MWCSTHSAYPLRSSISEKLSNHMWPGAVILNVISLGIMTKYPLLKEKALGQTWMAKPKNSCGQLMWLRLEPRNCLQLKLILQMLFSMIKFCVYNWRQPTTGSMCYATRILMLISKSGCLWYLAWGWVSILCFLQLLNRGKIQRMVTKSKWEASTSFPVNMFVWSSL